MGREAVAVDVQLIALERNIENGEGAAAGGRDDPLEAGQRIGQTHRGRHDRRAVRVEHRPSQLRRGLRRNPRRADQSQSKQRDEPSP